MTVWFIGAGPGDPELLTLQGRAADRACPVCLYAGSLVPAEVVAIAPEGARVRDTAPMTLDETHARDRRRASPGPGRGAGAFRRSVALWRHRRADPPAAAPRASTIDIVPGVPAYAAAAAALGQELTIPEVAQSIVLTRMAMKSLVDAAGRDAGESSPAPAPRWRSIWGCGRCWRSSGS